MSIKHYFFLAALVLIPVVAWAQTQKQLPEKEAQNLTRVAIPGPTNGSVLTINGATDAEVALTAGQTYRIYTDVAIKCEFGEAITDISADDNSTWGLGVDGYDYIHAFSKPGLIVTAISCQAENDSDTGQVRLHPVH